MPAVTDPTETPRPEPGFTVLSQRVELDIDLASRTVQGKTEITIQPTVKDLRNVRLNCRQSVLKHVTVEGKVAGRTYGDLYKRLQLYPTTGLSQYHFPKARIEALRNGEEDELVVHIPRNVQILELDPFSAAAQNSLLGRSGGATRREGVDPASVLETPTIKSAEEHGTLFAPIRINIEYSIDEFRDGLQFVGTREGDSKYPHVYTRNSAFPGTACCLFPCVDDSSSRCVWEILIRCPRTLGDVFRKPGPLAHGINGHSSGNGVVTNGLTSGIQKHDSATGSDYDDDYMGMSEEEKSLDISVVCSGDMTDEIVNQTDTTRKTVSFVCATPVLPQHIGFAVGPFEHVDLSDYRESDDDEKLGQNATRVHGFCLPGRADEVRNSCMCLAKAIDHFTVKYNTYPFTSYKLCFVDELASDVANSASLSICSTRLLFPEDILDPLDNVTRRLIHALATQWIGINVIPKDPLDWWVIVGSAYFMTDLCLQMFCGKNDYKFRQKLMADKVVEMDVSRPGLYQLGQILALDPGEMEFMELKAPLILSILHHRLIKQSGKTGVERCISRLLMNAKTGDLHNGSISTQGFFRICEKVGHQKLETFFNQWVYGAGCPSFQCNARFNKKKLVVEMIIKQVQGDPTQKQEEKFLDSSDFMREVKEHSHNIFAGLVQPVFMGPMTIRIHEADGTPYEHIVDITSNFTKVEIPYNTKYKRLKRSRRQKERAAAAQGLDISGDAQDDVLLYCLGDVLQSEEEVAEWRLTDWSKEDEERMNQESYEWIRIDADFEWICKTALNMPSYMYVSQLQQDKDIVAQLQSIQYLSQKAGHPLLSSIMVRTLMDGRYFHGIRTFAAYALASSARDELGWIGLFHLEKAFQELFCLPGSPMTRPNNFSNRSAYMIQCAIPRAIARIRDNSGKAPMPVKRFFMDKLKFNDNQNNEYSDCHYVAILMSCLAQTMTTANGPSSFNFSFEDEADEVEFQRNALAEIQRYQRIDEWIPSYQNVYTVTALDCQLTLMKTKAIPRRIPEFMQYVRVGNSDIVRLKAWSCLMDLGVLKNSAILKFMLYSIECDPSPYFQDQLLRIFCRGLGQIALGELKPNEQVEELNNGLIIEREEGVSDRQAELTRKKSVEGAVAALKEEVGNDVHLQSALEDALRSRNTSLNEVEELLEICSILYEPDDSLPITLFYPRYWAVKYLGKGNLKFSRTKRVRLTPIPPLVMPKTEISKSNAKSHTINVKPPHPHPEKPKRVPSLAHRHSQGLQAQVQAQAQLQAQTQLQAQAAPAVAPPPPQPLAQRPLGVTTSTPSSSQSQEPRPTLRRAPSSSSQTLPSPSPALSSPQPPAPGRKSRIIKLKLPKAALPKITSRKPSPTIQVAIPSAASHKFPVPAIPPARAKPLPTPAPAPPSPASSSTPSISVAGLEKNPEKQKRPSPPEAAAGPARAAAKPSLKLKLKLGGTKRPAEP